MKNVSIWRSWNLLLKIWRNFAILEQAQWWAKNFFSLTPIKVSKKFQDFFTVLELHHYYTEAVPYMTIQFFCLFVSGSWFWTVWMFIQLRCQSNTESVKYYEKKHCFNENHLKEGMLTIWTEKDQQGFVRMFCRVSRQ